MASVAGVRAGGEDTTCTQLKPEIFKTTDGKTIVEDELQNFLVAKMMMRSFCL